jgi:hypothetical protein
MNVDVEIYLNQFISFFEKNPSSLTELIGDINKDDFFNKVKEQCYINIEKGDDVSLTRSQIIEIVGGLLKVQKNDILVEKTNKLFQDTKFGQFCLN